VIDRAYAPEIVPDKVNTSPVGALIVAAPLIVIGLLSDTVVAPACKVVEAAIVNVVELEPNEALLVATKVPYERPVPPA
jgi:hypothetical protein